MPKTTTTDKRTLSDAETETIVSTVSGLFSLLADAMPQMVWATDADGSYFYFNRRWYEYTGLSESESLGFGFVTALHSDDMQPALRKWRAAWERGEDFEIEYRFRRQDGVYRWFVGRAMPIYDKVTGRVRMWIGTCTDIDDQRRALEALQESQSRLSMALESARLGTWEFDFSETGFFASERTRELFGQTEDRLYPVEEWASLVHEEDREQATTAFRSYLTYEPPYTAPEATVRLQYRTRRPDQSVRYVLVMGARVYDGSPEPRRIVGVIQDITEQHDTLEALRESADALRAREDQYRLLFDTVTHGVVYQDADGNIIDANPAAERILGLTLDQMQGRVSTDPRWRAVREDGTAFPGSEHPVPIARRTGKPIRDVPMGIYHPQTGKYHWLSVSAVPLFRDGEEKPYLVYAYLEDITERRAAQAELQKSESRYRTLTEVLPQVVWAGDENGAMTYCNQYWYEYTWFSSEQTEGDGWINAVHPEDREQVASTWRATVEKGVGYEMEIRFRRGYDGIYRWFLVRGRPIRDPKTRQVRQWLGTALDIHDRKRADEYVRRSEERFRSLVEATAQIVWAASPAGEVIAEQAQWAAHTGQSFEEYKGYGWLQAVYPDDRELTTIRWSHALANKTLCELEHRVRDSAGEYHWFALRAVPVLDSTGEVREWIGTETDIMDRKRTERALRESEERFRSLVEATTQIIWDMKAGGEFTSEQLPWSAFTGQRFPEYSGMGWLDAVHPEERAETERGWRAALLARTHYSTEHRLRRSDGAYRYMSVRAMPILNSDGSVREWIGIHTDITERKEAEQALAAYATKQARVAETLQRSLLNAPPDRAFPPLVVFTQYEAAWAEAQVGGDFFDVFALDNNKTAFVIGDVTGKGLKAAEHTGQIKYALRAFLRENPDPGDALQRLNRLLTDAHRLDPPTDANGAMAVVTTAVFDAATRVVQVAGGGAEPPIHYKVATGTAHEIRTRGMIVGAYPNSEYDITERTLEPGDLLLMATDGITEGRRGRREFFGIEGLIDVIERTAAQTNEPVAVINAVIAAAKAFTRNGTLHDDICLIAARLDLSD